MPEHLTRDQRVLYDHEHDAGPRRRQADDWGIDESFPRVRGRRFSRAQGATPRSRRHPVEDWGGEAAFDAAPEHEAPEQQLSEPGAPAPPSADLGPLPVKSDERRTIRINGRPDELSEIAPFVSSAARHRPPQTIAERLAGDPTRIIAMAFALGMLLILIAVLTS
jgi:hypothetical protein